MDPEGRRALIVISLLAVGSIGAAVSYHAVVGPPAPGTEAPDADEVVTLVGYPLQTLEVTTDTLDFPSSGVAEFPPLPVPLRNITSLTITMRVTMEGTSVNDQFDLVVVAPDGEEITGQDTRQTTPNGYTASVPMVQGWDHADRPQNEHYQTADEAMALRWAAENHTEDDWTGDWDAEVSLSPPVGPLRQGNVSLTYTFTFYRAVAFPPMVETDDPRGTQFFSAARRAW